MRKIIGQKRDKAEAKKNLLRSPSKTKYPPTFKIDLELGKVEEPEKIEKKELTESA